MLDETARAQFRARLQELDDELAAARAASPAHAARLEAERDAILDELKPPPVLAGGDVTLALTLAGQIRSISGGGGIERVPGTTRVTGTATSRYGTYTVDLTR